MRTLILSVVTGAAALLSGNAPASAQGPNFKNLVGAHLVGSWILKDDVTAMLAGPGGGERVKTITFREDASVEAKLTGPAGDFIKKQGVFMSGVMGMSDRDYPFVLTQVAGSPYLFWFRARGGDPMGDAESFFISVAVGGSRDKDLLFIGGDFDNQAFSAYSRAQQK